MSIRALFDTERFWTDVDHIRQERKVSWNFINQATGLGGLCKGHLADNPRIDTLVLVAVWADLSLDAYIQVFDRSGQMPQKQPQRYDVARFYADLDRVRVARGLTWYGVFRSVPDPAVPCSLSTYVAKHTALHPSAREALAKWANLSFSEYLE